MNVRPPRAAKQAIVRYASDALHAVDYVLLALATFAVAALWAIFLVEYGRLPSIIPTHFGPTGLPNHWGSKQVFVTFPLVGTTFYAITLGIYRGIIPQRKPIPPLALRFVLALLAETTLLFGVLEWNTVAVAQGSASQLGPAFLVILFLVFATAIGLVVTAVASGRSSVS